MGLIENIQDYFVKNSQEYKAFINKMKEVSPEEFNMDGERKFSKKEQNFLKVFDKDQSKKTAVYSDSSEVQINNLNDMPKQDVVLSTKDFRPTYLDEKDKVEIIPATDEQKLQYSKHIEGIEFTDKPSVDFPKFSQAQLNSVPDIIDGVPVNEYEKKMILLGSFEYTGSNNWSSTFSIDNNNKLVTTYLDIDANKEVFEITKHISKQDVMYVNQNEIELKKEKVQNFDGVSFESEKFKIMADKLSNHYEKAGESMFNFNKKEGKEILEYALYLKEFPDNVKNVVLDYLLIEPPSKPNFHDFPDSFEGENLYDEAIENYISKELPKYNYEQKSLSQVLINYGIDSEKIPPIKPHEVNYFNVLLNDVNKILTENNKDLQKETVKSESTKHVQLSSESNLSIDNIYGFKPTEQQKKDLENGKGITGEIQGKNYFIQLSAQAKNKGSLQILSIEKAKEFKLIPELKNNNKNIKQIGLRA